MVFSLSAGLAPWGTVIWCLQGKPAPPLHLLPQQMGTGTDWIPRTRIVRTGALGRNLSLQTQVPMGLASFFINSAKMGGQLIAVLLQLR